MPNLLKYFTALPLEKHTSNMKPNSPGLAENGLTNKYVKYAFSNKVIREFDKYCIILIYKACLMTRKSNS